MWAVTTTPNTYMFICCDLDPTRSPQIHLKIPPPNRPRSAWPLHSMKTWRPDLPSRGQLAGRRPKRPITSTRGRRAHLRRPAWKTVSVNLMRERDRARPRQGCVERWGAAGCHMDSRDRTEDQPIYPLASASSPKALHPLPPLNVFALCTVCF